MPDIEIIGAPFSSAGMPGGLADAPAALRAAGLSAVLRGGGRTVHDGGDIDVGVLSPDRDPTSGLRALSALTSTTGSVRAAVGAALDVGRFPLVLGGDCPILLGALRAVQDRVAAAGLLCVDGHQDVWPPRRSVTGEAADCELGLALGRHRDGLPSALTAQLPRLDADAVAVLGPRDDADRAEHGVKPLDGATTVVSDARLRGRAGPLVDAVVQRWRSAGRSWWCHVDLDVLSTAAFPAVDYPQPGGLDWVDLAAIGRAGLVDGCVGMSVVIYNPELDPNRRHAATIVEHLAEVLAAAEQAPERS